MDSKYAGMTVNERLHVNGLIDDFDRAVEKRDVAKVVSILREIELTDVSICPILNTLGFGQPKGTLETSGIMKYLPNKSNLADINQVANGSFLPAIILKPDEKK